MESNNDCDSYRDLLENLNEINCTRSSSIITAQDANYDKNETDNCQYLWSDSWYYISNRFQCPISCQDSAFHASMSNLPIVRTQELHDYHNCNSTRQIRKRKGLYDCFTQLLMIIASYNYGDALDLKSIECLIINKNLHFPFKASIWKLLINHYKRNEIADGHELEKISRLNSHSVNSDSIFTENSSDSIKSSEHIIKADVKRLVNLRVFNQKQRVVDILLQVLIDWCSANAANLQYSQGMHEIALQIVFVVCSSMPNSNYSLINERKSNNNADSNDFMDISLFGAQDFKMLYLQTSHIFSALIQIFTDYYSCNLEFIMDQFQVLKQMLRIECHEVYNHICRLHFDLTVFCFKWFNNLLIRELSAGLVADLWDYYFIDPANAKYLHTFVCLALIVRMKSLILKTQDFGSLAQLFQNFPHSYTRQCDIDIHGIVNQAKRLRGIYLSADQRQVSFEEC